MNTMKALMTLGLFAAMVFAAAPPTPMGPVRLTAEQQKHVDELVVKANESASKGDFEDVVSHLREIVEYRTKHLGDRHWQVIGGKLLAEEWKHLTKVPRKDREDVVRAKQLNREMGRLLSQRKNVEAEAKVQEAVAICERILGEDHPETAALYDDRAYCLQVLGKLQEALPLYRKALAVRGKALSPEHPLTARSYNNVASCLRALGKSQEALVLYEKALAIREKALGAAYPDTAIAYNNLASCLDLLGKKQEALWLYQKALSVYVQVHGEGHADTATASNNVGYSLESLGKSQEALPYYQKALAGRETALGETHPDTARSYISLAGCLQALARPHEALPLAKKALTINEQVFGENHPETAQSYNDVATYLHSLGKAQEAMPLLLKALAINEKAYGQEHPTTATSYNNTANCMASLGKLSAALSMYQKAQAIREKALGESHPSTVASVDNVAHGLVSLNQSADALRLFQKALGVREKTLGEGHPLTATSYDNVASCLLLLGKAEEALLPFRKALTGCEKTLGESHPQTAQLYNNMGFCLQSLGKVQEALAMLRKAQAVRERTFGTAHPLTAASYNNVAGTLYRAGDYAEAERAYRVAVVGREYGRRYAGESGFGRSHFEADKLSPHLGVAACLIRQGKPTEAWAQAEAHLARGLLEDLDVEKVGDESGRIEALNARLVPLLARPDLSEAERNTRDALLQQRAKLESEQAKGDLTRVLARTVSLAQLQKQLPADTAIVLWIDLDSLGEHLACVVRQKGEPTWVRLGDLTEDEKSLAGQVLKTLQKRSTPTGVRLLAQLQKQRLAPLEKHLEGVKRLLVVPTNRMAAVPVETLSDRFVVSYIPSGSVYAKQMEDHRTLKGDSLFILADPTFSAATPPEPPPAGVALTAVVPGSAAAVAGLRPGDVLLKVGETKLKSVEDLVAALKQPAPHEVVYWRDGEENTTRIAGGTLGVAIDKRPAPEAVRARRKEQTQHVSRGDWQALPGTRVEMDLLKGLVAKHTLLSADEATEQNLERMAEKGKLKHFRLLHLATHGEANPLAPAQTALILSQHKTPTLDENAARARAGKLELTNRLTVDAVLRTWVLDADLVTLSACETGLGANYGGEGMLGFAQALLQKGARSVLLSRWKVDDAATSLLMLRFYQNVLGKRDDLTKPMGRADALYEAKKWLRELSRDEALKHLTKLTDSLPRSERGKVGRLPDKKTDAPKDKGDRPFDSPCYWAAFVLIGDPD